MWLDEVVGRLAARGWRVTVLTRAYPGRPDHEVVDGVRYRRAGGTFSQYAAAHVSERALPLPATVVLDVFNGVPFLSALAHHRPTVVVVHHVHREQWGMVFGPVLARAGWFLEHRVAARVQRDCHHVTVSEASARDIVEQYGVDPTRISIARNGCTPAPAVAPARLSPAALHLVTVGRLVPHKRVEVAIATVARARAAGLDAHLDVVGDGEWAPDLRREAEHRAVADHVTFHGWVDEPRKHAILAASDLMLLPSVREGWGLVVGEAGQHGVPTIAFRSAGGVRESVVDGRTGELAGDDDDMVDRALALLVDGPRRRAYGAAAHDHATRFTWDACASTVEAALATAILAHDGAPAPPRWQPAHGPGMTPTGHGAHTEESADYVS